MREPGGNHVGTRRASTLATSIQTIRNSFVHSAFKIKGVRTIVLLSDGMPYRATDPIDGAALLDHIDTVNRFEHVPIHTIGFKATAGSASSFLQELSRRSGGKYTEIP